ncbi:hypothetical protein NON00_23845, partial [Roseomonas sp. GC11]
PRPRIQPPFGVARAAAAMAAGCDGLEFDAEGLEPWRLLCRLDAALARWGAERLGVRLRGLPVMDSRAAEWRAVDLLAALNERELGFVHLAGPLPPGQAQPSLRAAFRWPLLVSGRMGAAEAIRLVESRWADAVGFAAADGPALLRRLRHACPQGMPPGALRGGEA